MPPSNSPHFLRWPTHCNGERFPEGDFLSVCNPISIFCSSYQPHFSKMQDATEEAHSPIYCQFLHSGASFLLPAPLGLEEDMRKRSYHYSFPHMRTGRLLSLYLVSFSTWIHELRMHVYQISQRLYQRIPPPHLNTFRNGASWLGR